MKQVTQLDRSGPCAQTLRPPLTDVVLAGVVAALFSFGVPVGTFAANPEGQGSGPDDGGAPPLSEDPVEPKDCECIAEDDGGSATWSVTCQALPGVGGLLGTIFDEYECDQCPMGFQWRIPNNPPWPKPPGTP